MDFLQSIVDQYVEGAKLKKASFVSGGCINNTQKLETTSGSYFIKWKQNEPELFEKERLGLNLLRDKSLLKIPEVIGSGEIEGNHFLLLEFVESGRRKSDFWEDFGIKLAAQHREINDRYGLDFDNHIGRLPQDNTAKSEWLTFFIENRLEAQLRESDVIPKDFFQRFDRLFGKLEDLIPEEPASLLHGDLWSGNFMVSATGDPCIFDPAVYYGHREVELAFTQMFGGFENQFYASYENEWPLEPGFDQRVDIHNLYPLLVHVNLFGASYLAGIDRTLKRFT